MQNFSFLGHLEMPWNFFPMLNLSGLRGSAPRQQFWVSKFFSCSFRASVNQYTDFHVSTIPESALHHISSCDRGPWLRPWTEMFGFRNFSFGFEVNPITVQNFSFVGNLQVPVNFSHVKPMGKPSGAPGSAHGKKFRVFKFFHIVLGKQ